MAVSRSFGSMNVRVMCCVMWSVLLFRLIFAGCLPSVIRSRHIARIYFRRPSLRTADRKMFARSAWNLTGAGQDWSLRFYSLDGEVFAGLIDSVVSCFISAVIGLLFRVTLIMIDQSWMLLLSETGEKPSIYRTQRLVWLSYAGLPVCSSVYLSACLSVSPSACLSVCLYVGLSDAVVWKS